MTTTKIFTLYAVLYAVFVKLTNSAHVVAATWFSENLKIPNFNAFPNTQPQI